MTAPDDLAAQQAQRMRRHNFMVVAGTLGTVATLLIAALTINLLPSASAPAAGAGPAGAVTTGEVRKNLHNMALGADDLIRLLEALDLEPVRGQKAPEKKGE